MDFAEYVQRVQRSLKDLEHNNFDLIELQNTQNLMHAEAERLVSDALAIDQAGASAIVLELVHAPLAAAISKQTSCPTIGIGSGKDCDGGILVLHDLIGLFPWFRPKFAQPRADVATTIQQAVREYCRDIRNPAD